MPFSDSPADAPVPRLPVLLYGATGYTGRLCAETLSRRRIPFLLAGRDLGRLQELAVNTGGDPKTVRVADAKSPSSLEPLFDGVSAVINCAGPFTDVGLPVVERAVLRGVSYVDTTGEQPFMHASFQRHDEEARENGVCVIHAGAFEYALGDTASALLGRRFGAYRPDDAGGALHELHITYAVKAFGTSRGTKKSILRVLEQPGLVYDGGRLEPVPPGRMLRRVKLPFREKPITALVFGGGEAVQVPLHTNVQVVRSYITMGRLTPWIAPVLGPALPLLRFPGLQSALFSLIDGAAAEGPDRVGREQTQFAVIAEAVHGAEQARLTLSGRDVYGLTAEIAVEIGRRLALKEHRRTGVTGVSGAFDPDDFGRFLAGRGVAFDGPHTP